MVKEYKDGLVLGKFMPPQNGHLYLIDKSALYCENLYVMICSDETQPISGELRYGWLREIYKNNKNIHIVWCQDKNPQYPEDAESVEVFYEKYWVPSVKSRLGRLDVIFTSEEYGKEFAAYLGIKHVLIDQSRRAYAVSATDIRNDPYSHWWFIPDVVKSYFIKKVVIIGPESTGKTTLTKKLANHFNAAHILGESSEYGRIYAKAVGTETLKQVDFEQIVESHGEYLWEYTHRLAEPSKLLFVDTEAITTKVFCEMYLGSCNSQVIEERINTQEFDLYLLLDVDVPWVDDGTRDFPNYREQHLNALKRELESRGIKYTLIGGDYEQRYQKAIKEVENLYLTKK